MTETPLTNLALKSLRVARDWSSAELADALGISRPTLSKLEAGKPQLSRERLESIAGILGAGKEAVAAALAFVATVAPRFSPDAMVGPGALTEADRAFIEEAVALGAAELRTALTQAGRRARLEHERSAAVAYWSRLKAEPSASWRDALEAAPEERTGALLIHLCEESERRASHRAEEALKIAELAVWLADRISGGDGFRTRALGFALAFLGSAHRVANHLDAAESLHARANELFARGEDDMCLLDGLRVLDLDASLHRDLRNFERALDLLERALGIATEAERPRLLLKRAFTLEQSGEFSAAIADLCAARPAIDRAAEVRPRLVLRFNLATNFVHLGKPEEAREHLPEIHLLTNALGFDLDGIRVRWLEGRIAEAEGRKTEAISAYESVIEQFARLEQGADAALAGLEAAALHLERGNLRKVRSLASGVRLLLGTHGIEREELMAVRLFVEAAEREAATVALAREAARALKFGGAALSRALQEDFIAPRPRSAGA